MSEPEKEMQGVIRSIELEHFASQNEIIALQKAALDEAFMLLNRHANVTEEELQPLVDKINRAAEIRAECGF